jgi:hypothetical protein
VKPHATGLHDPRFLLQISWVWNEPVIDMINKKLKFTNFVDAVALGLDCHGFACFHDGK